MVRICKGVCNDVPSFIPRIAAVVQQSSHKLGDSECRVSVVDVDSDLFVQVVQSAVNSHMLVYDIAYRSGAEEILLTQSERFALSVVVVRIQYLCDSL